MSQHYFDYAASAPRREEVAEAMAPYLHGVVGNPAGQHRASRDAKRVVEDAREEIAALVSIEPKGVIFTSGGTEANHLALTGAVLRRRRVSPGPTNVVVSAAEHSSVLETARHLATMFDDVTTKEIPLYPSGHVFVDDAYSLITPETAVVSVMAVNNEIGLVQPFEPVMAIARQQAGADVLCHSDAVAAAPWFHLPTITSTIDAFSVCAHKLGGPVNSGALFVRRLDLIDPVVVGGGQERGMRGGTVDVAAVVGLAAAMRVTARERIEVCTRVRDYAVRLYGALSFLPGCAVTSQGEDKVEGIVHVTFDNIPSEELLFLLDQEGIFASAGAACASGAQEPSHVLRAMKMAPNRVGGALRLSMGPGPTEEDVDKVIDALSRIIYSRQEK